MKLPVLPGPPILCLACSAPSVFRGRASRLRAVPGASGARVAGLGGWRGGGWGVPSCGSSLGTGCGELTAGDRPPCHRSASQRAARGKRLSGSPASRGAEGWGAWPVPIPWGLEAARTLALCPPTCWGPHASPGHWAQAPGGTAGTAGHRDDGRAGPGEPSLGRKETKLEPREPGGWSLGGAAHLPGGGPRPGDRMGLAQSSAGCRGNTCKATATPPNFPPLPHPRPPSLGLRAPPVPAGPAPSQHLPPRLAGAAAGGGSRPPGLLNNPHACLCGEDAAPSRVGPALPGGGRAGAGAEGGLSRPQGPQRGGGKVLGYPGAWRGSCRQRAPSTPGSPGSRLQEP